MNENRYYEGSGVISVLTIVFIVLKIAGVIHWPWIWVLSPIWILFALAIMLGLVLKIIDIFGKRMERWLFKIWTGDGK